MSKTRKTNGVNPRKIPRTQADVDKARAAGFDEGIKGALAIVLYTLHDKFAADEAQLKEFSDEFNYTLDSINRGYIKRSDLECVLKDEYGTTIIVK